MGIISAIIPLNSLAPIINYLLSVFIFSNTTLKIF